MSQAFVVTLRQGLEAFLIVAVSLAYLKKSGLRELVPAVHWGIGVSVLLSIGAAGLFQQASNQVLWEGLLAIVAAVLVASLMVHVRRGARQVKRGVEGRPRPSTPRPGVWAVAGIFGFTLLMITREGMETALLMNVLLFQIRSVPPVLGAVLGIVCAASVAWLWACYGHRVDLVRFFQVTVIFLLVFVIQLFIYGFHELTEANILPYSEFLHLATEPYGPDGRYGQYLIYLLVILPTAWLGVSTWCARRTEVARPA